MATGPGNQQTGQAGEHFVAAEMNRRGAYAVTFAGNMPKIDILASNHDRTREVSIQVKTRRAGTWHASIDDGRKCKTTSKEKHFWVFVDIENVNAPPTYYVVPLWWIQNNIYETHDTYLKKHGGSRAKNPNSKHHGIDPKRIVQWKERWNILKLFES